MIALEFDLAEMARAMGAVRSARRKFEHTDELMDGIAALLEQQTKRRISDEKTDPNGSRWDPWSPPYAATRAGHHSLLIDTQNLLDSIAGQGTADTATVGSELAYAAAQNFGRPDINLPARTFLGISEDNAVDINDAVKAWLKAIL